MSNYIRGDLLVYTRKGIKRLDKLTKDDMIQDENNNYNEIGEITRMNIKNFYLYKIKTIHNIDNYYLGGTNKQLCIQNIPYDMRMKDCPTFIDENVGICSPTMVKVSEITEFDYIGYPYMKNDDIIGELSVDENDKYRFQGLILLQTGIFTLNNNINKNTIGFLNKYLHNNNIANEFFNNNITTTIKINIENIDVITAEEINNLSYDMIVQLIKGFIEINSVINTTNKATFYLLKNLFMKIGILLNANYNNNNYIIKIPQTLDIVDCNYFIYKNYIWSKIKKITKSEKYTGLLYTITPKNNVKMLTEIGIIS
jgi:hypothetical protein